jgi:hypothetical protein
MGFFDTISSSLGSLESILTSLAQSFGGGGWAAKPVNLVWNYQPGQTLAQAIQQTLQTAFPQATLNIAVSPNLKLNYADVGYYQSLTQFAMYIRQLSMSIMGTPGQGYNGITIWPYGNTIYVADQTQSASGTVALNFEDLIGQPTWIAVNTIQIKTYMRSDLVMGKNVTLPAGTPVTSTSQAIYGLSGTNQFPLTFTGSYNITKVLHVGDSRHPDGAQWCTVVDATAVPGQASQTSSGATTGASGTTNTPAPAPTAAVMATAERFAQRRIRRYG